MKERPPNLSSSRQSLIYIIEHTNDPDERLKAQKALAEIDNLQNIAEAEIAREIRIAKENAILAELARAAALEEAEELAMARNEHILNPDGLPADPDERPNEA